MKSIKSIYETGKRPDGNNVLKNTTKAYPGHELFKKNPSLHANGSSANGISLKDAVDAINGSADLKNILPKNIKSVPTFKDTKYADLYKTVNPLSNGTFSNLDSQTDYDRYQDFLSNLGNSK